MPVGRMVNRIGLGDVDAQWFRRASNPHPPDCCGRSAMLSYGTMLPPISHTDGMGENGGWAICDADPIRFIGVCRRAPSRPSKSPWRTRGLFGLAACLVSFQPDSNRRPSASEADALSTELWNVGGFSTRTYYASVGLAGFEPAASRPPAGRATGLRHNPQGRFSRPAGTARPCGSRVTEERVRPVARMRRSCRIRVVPPAGFEPATPTFGRWRSIL